MSEKRGCSIGCLNLLAIYAGVVLVAEGHPLLGVALILLAVASR